MAGVFGGHSLQVPTARVILVAVMASHSAERPSRDSLLAELRARIQRLHREAGEPSTRELARELGRGVLSHETVHIVLRCAKAPRWDVLELVVKALGGDVEEFRRLWIALRDAEDPAAEFRFYVDTLVDGQVVRDDDLPLSIEGRYAERPPPVRVILEDSYQNYYAQNPPVSFQADNTWRAGNILPGEGIMFIHFVAVDGEGKRTLDRMVERRQFGAFSELPPGSRVLRSIAIDRS